MAAASVEQLSASKMFGGWNKRYRHTSDACGCDMTFTVFFPPASDNTKVPVIYYLSGLTCTDENFIQKAGAQRDAARLGVALIVPDTSPRGLNVPGEAESYDLGVGAGFYVNATVEKWKNWRMYDYVVSELPEVLKANFSNLDLTSSAITGHSMGGHGALTIGLKNPGSFKAISAFAPICNPSQVPWGTKAFLNYLGEDRQQWLHHDATELMRNYVGPQLPILVDTGKDDKFLVEQLKPEALEAACKSKSYPATFRMHDGYDHSYNFVASFIPEHIEFLAKHLA